jgi:hypothetical protein
VSVFFCSPTTNMMMRARAGGQKGAVAQVLQGAHIDFHITSPDELVENDVALRLLACGGAHRPDSYLF